MKKLLITLLFSFYFSTVPAQNDHLNPMGGVLTGYTYRIDYHQKLREKFGFNNEDSPTVRYIVIPSFDTEYALDIRFGDGVLYVENLTFSESIWYSKKRDEVKLKKKTNIISQEDVNLLEELFKLAIYTSRYSKSNIAVSDGTTYIYSVFYNGVLSAQTHSPRKGTLIYELKEVTEELIRETSEKKFNGISKLLKDRINNLIYKFFLSESNQEELTKYKIKKSIVNSLNKTFAFTENDLPEHDFDFVYLINKKGVLQEVKPIRYKFQTDKEYQRSILRKKVYLDKFKKELLGLKLPQLLPLKNYEIAIYLQYGFYEKKFIVIDNYEEN